MRSDRSSIDNSGIVDGSFVSSIYPKGSGQDKKNLWLELLDNVGIRRE